MAIHAASSFSASFPLLMKIQRQCSYWRRTGEPSKGGRDKERAKHEEMTAGGRRREKLGCDERYRKREEKRKNKVSEKHMNRKKKG